jgi:hypothetical protein
MYRVGGARGLDPMGTLNVPVANCVGPAVADGRLVVRTLDAICCYELRKEQAAVAADHAKLLAAALGADERLAAAATVACAAAPHAVEPLVRATLEDALGKKDAARFARVADMAAALGTNGTALVVEQLVAALGGRAKEAAMAACSFSSRAWPVVTQESLRTRLLHALAGAAKGSDAGVAKAALSTLGGFGPEADSVAEELKTGVDPDLTSDVAAAVKKIYAAEQDTGRDGKPKQPDRSKEVEIPVPSLDL